jgi:energy-converting hydrogenase A subunit R
MPNKTKRIHIGKSKRVFISDCEGPISRNDNAFELSSEVIPEGDRFFGLLSKYDDVLADIMERQGYKAGNTLKLILPFLKAYGATNNWIKEYSAKNILLVPGAKETLQYVERLMPSFIVSTSYDKYIHSLCDLVRFPIENVFCTELDIDKTSIDNAEKLRLRELKKEISSMSMIEISEKAKSLEDLSLQDQKNVKRLDKIFWKEISQMKSGKIVEDTNPIGGYEKVKAINTIIERTQSDLSDTMYIGDSITDVSSLKLVKKSGGAAISFNGNKYAIREAEIAVLSDNTIIISSLASVFQRHGKDGVLEFVREWDYDTIERYVDPVIRNPLKEIFTTELPQVEIINEANIDRLSRESNYFRKTVRGALIGSLG